ncbi:MAG TPA: DUF1877 family protein [Gordonia sp. (in: high G+C Gram-positive bacteria)]|uniref:DUF1877 family protein n=1 Tax=unclassified Gordonia (in: high G+C Gram-positive bacteria) TaxID=2657482 RepID=UPI000FC148C9|nr:MULTISPECIES: DUF1877 family protein [unclassified Gordonia (in: high G+C Gram-positive bacteria)]RUP41042.1 MAG: DUF1877 family protein [Gordonia sp. (in: high G+C Gram-positive bacteria)]HNP56943.1 DUF1877 family protein [Gordonia sp. (in: high G+C Gram-positive bacteria)]HRC50387.1 DUF1877 family protein [Gordonia sp. (in: high G+C Gram-positive bacteria)]
MGIRYYAYAYEAENVEQAVANPASVISDDPLADAWGFEPHTYGVINATFEQSVPEADMLYLDKAWSLLQCATEPNEGEPARPAFRMFEGQVTQTGMGHLPFVRVLTPAEVVDVAKDLADISDQEVADRLHAHKFYGPTHGDDLSYALDYLERARTFMRGLVGSGRGMAYTIR